MSVERLSLENGDWIDFVARLNHAQLRRILRARSSAELDTITETVAALVANWSLHDVNGNPIHYPGGAADGVVSSTLDLIPADVMVEAFGKAAEIFAGKPDPKGSGETSPDSQPGSQ